MAPLAEYHQDEQVVDEREAATGRIRARRDFGSHFVVFLIVNAALVGVWSLSGGYFWPAWVMAAWGVGIFMHAWDVFLRPPITEADIAAEIEREHRRARR
ncbi:MAG TPA: 2TM domain-containing protein [Acidimicrobiales bacterium]|nr:2TM domain-containing protein [Acidimicrobiales bacterium]